MDAEKQVRGWRWKAALCWPSKLMVALAAVSLAAAFGATNTRATVPHPFHISTAEMEYNSKEQRLEVALKLHSADLENALSREAGRRINVEKDDIKELVEKYLNQHFQVFAVEPPSESEQKLNASDDNSAGQTLASKAAQSKPVMPSPWLSRGAEVAKKNAGLRSQVKFVGHELETSWLWIYFELKLDPELSEQASDNRWGMRNSILMDAIRDQLNTVSIRSGSERHSLKFSRQVFLHEFDSSWIADPKPARLKQDSGS